MTQVQLPSTASSVDANGRRYIAQADGTVRVDDSAVKSTAVLPPPPVLPPLAEPPACGASHCLAVHRSLGEVISWATSKSGDRFGQLGWAERSAGVPLYEARHVSTPADCGRVVRVAAGDSHSALVDEHGSLYAWGCDRWTQLGQELLWVKGAEPHSFEFTEALPSLPWPLTITCHAAGCPSFKQTCNALAHRQARSGSVSQRWLPPCAKLACAWWTSRAEPTTLSLSTIASRSGLGGVASMGSASAMPVAPSLLHRASPKHCRAGATSKE